MRLRSALLERASEEMALAASDAGGGDAGGDEAERGKLQRAFGLTGGPGGVESLGGGKQRMRLRRNLRAEGFNVRPAAP